MMVQGAGGTGEGFEVQKYGDGRVALIGNADSQNSLSEQAQLQHYGDGRLR